MSAYIYKYDLAQSYFPNVSPSVATRLLSREIQRNAMLMAELQDANYRPSQKRFTPRQVQIIFRYIGEP